MSIEVKEYYTPMIKQYLEVKNTLLDAIVFYRLGDFYEMFFDDAKIASKELDLVLTGRNGGNNEKIPMCGVPFHAANNYIYKLTERGYKIAIVEQAGEVVSGKLVNREVTKIITPGSIMDEQIDEKSSNYIVSVYDDYEHLILVYCELSCGELKAQYVERNNISLKKAIMSLDPKEVIVNSDLNTEYLKMLQKLPNIVLSFEDNHELKKNYEYLIKNNQPYLKDALGQLINYLEYIEKTDITHFNELVIIPKDAYLKLDYASKQNLELTHSIHNKKALTLWQFLDEARSSMGSRKLKNWIEFPLVNKKEINLRLDMIEFLQFNFIMKDELKEYLNNIYDLERICTKIAYNTCNPKDLKRLSTTLKYAPMIIDIFSDFKPLAVLQKIDVCKDLNDLLKDIIVDEPPTSYKDGNVFVEGYNEQLDALRELSSSGQKFILDLENRERERTGISSLKIGFNKVFGYYIEVRKSNIDKIKDEYGYIRKQTLAQAERFVTAELKEKEDEILHAKERSLELEKVLYLDLLEKIKVYLPKLYKLAEALSYIDAIYALSVISDNPNYHRPQFNDGHVINIKNGFHPILDHLMDEKPYIANDLVMDQDDVIHLITGPNMGGKSTYMRQVALIAIMAQIGCFVPASEASLPIFDQIFTRIGANDDITSGQSTFMVEMNEANFALRNATENSLILFDEIGRGTSTYDGMSLACAMIEYISEHLKAKTLFSTHYHELTSLSEKYNNIHNYHVEVHEEDDEVTFLYKVLAGKADKSYGINVAKLADLPSELIMRAKVVLNNLEQEKIELNSDNFEEIKEEKPTIKSEVITMLEDLNVDDLTPKQALMLLYDLKQKV